MGLSKVESLCRPLQKRLETYTDGQPGNRRDLLGDLLMLMVTGQPPTRLKRLADEKRIRGLKTRLRKATRYFQKYSNLPECLCARYKYLVGEARARRLYDVSSRTWAYVHRLADEVGFDLPGWVASAHFSDYRWHDKLEEQMMRVDVLLEPHALDDMLVAAYEAYLSPRKKKRKGYEVYGVALGMTRETTSRAARKGLTIQRFVSVMRCQPQLSAEGAMGWVEPNDRSMLALHKATATLFPHTHVLGDFHSHPYDNWADLIWHEGWKYSNVDQSGNVKLAREMPKTASRYQIAFIVALARSARKVRRRHFRGLKHTIQLTVGDCRAVVAVYRSLESGRYTTQRLQLRLPGMIQ